MSTFNLNQLLKEPEKYAKKLSINDLEELIIVLKDYYYNTDTPLVPDAIYDQVEDVLLLRKPDSSILISVGAPVKEAVKLPYAMPSLNKAKSGAGTTSKWLDKYPGPYTVSYKLDGVSLMYYVPKNGPPQLFTRGNGTQGQNVTGLLKHLDMGKIKIPNTYKKPIAIRGEAIMKKEVWDKYYAKDYPNVRNWVAGILNSKTPDPISAGRVQFVAYQLVVPRKKHSEQFNILDKWGFYSTSYSVEENLDEAELMVKLDYARQYGEYQIDGLVVVQDQNFELTTENPKHSIAFKSMSEEVAQTTVIKVIWKASKRFMLKPTVIIEPVFLSGGNLSKATGHYAKYIVENKIGPGAIVTIVRSGEVIPYIVSVDKQAKFPDLPEIEYEWTEGGYDIMVTEETEEVSEAILSYMASSLGIDNLGQGTIKKIVELGYNSPAEVLNMTLEEWKEIPSLGKNAEKIWTSLQKLETEGVWLSQLMDASSIFERGIGRKKMQLVLDAYPNLLDMEDDPKLVSYLIKIKGIEIKTAEKIVNGLSDFNEFLDDVPHIRLKDEDDSYDDESNEDKIPEFNGMRVVFTGVRDKELDKIITNSGGEVANSVSKTHKNQVIIAKDPNAKSNKLIEARKLDIEIYSLIEFKQKYGV